MWVDGLGSFLALDDVIEAKKLIQNAISQASADFPSEYRDKKIAAYKMAISLLNGEISVDDFTAVVIAE